MKIKIKYILFCETCNVNGTLKFLQSFINECDILIYRWCGFLRDSSNHVFAFSPACQTVAYSDSRMGKFRALSQALWLSQKIMSKDKDNDSDCVYWSPGYTECVVTMSDWFAN